MKLALEGYVSFLLLALSLCFVVDVTKLYFVIKSLHTCKEAVISTMYHNDSTDVQFDTNHVCNGIVWNVREHGAFKIVKFRVKTDQKVLSLISIPLTVEAIPLVKS